MKFASATNLDRNSGVAKRSDCLGSQAESAVGCGKDVDPVHLENAMRWNAFAFTTFPQRCCGGLTSKDIRLGCSSKLASYLSCLGVQSHQ